MSDRDIKYKPPVLKESDILDEPERRVERHLTWGVKIKYYLEAIDRLDVFLTQDIAAVTAAYLVTSPVPAVMTVAQMNAAIAAYAQVPTNRTIAVGMIPNNVNAATLTAYLVREATPIYKIQRDESIKALAEHQKKVDGITEKSKLCFSILISALEESLIVKYQIAVMPPAQQTPMNLWNIINEDFHTINDSTRLYYTNLFDHLAFDSDETIKDKLQIIFLALELLNQMLN